MKKFLLALPILMLVGCEGHYRYPCQDPANWGKLECNNESCKAEGTCTSDVLGLNASITVPTQEVTESEETIEEGNNEISSNDCSSPKTRVYNKSEKIESNENNSSVSDDVPSRTPVALEEEQPLTMSSLVDTAEHNIAIR